MEFIRDEEKDEIVRRRVWWQGIGFEDIAKAIQSWQKANEAQNDSQKYDHQGMFIVNINDYPYKVPFHKINDDTYYLITFYPSRKHKSYL